MNGFVVPSNTGLKYFRKTPFTAYTCANITMIDSPKILFTQDNRFHVLCRIFAKQTHSPGLRLQIQYETADIMQQARHRKHFLLVPWNTRYCRDPACLNGDFGSMLKITANIRDSRKGFSQAILGKR